MKVIKRVVPARISISYQCETCLRKYRTEKRAKECEKLRLDKQKFNKGDRIRNTAPQHCGCNNYKQYYFRGIIIKVDGPYPTAGGHIYYYQVKYQCPDCKKFKEGSFLKEGLKKL